MPSCQMITMKVKEKVVSFNCLLPLPSPCKWSHPEGKFDRWRSTYAKHTFSIKSGISTAIQGPKPRAIAWAIPATAIEICSILTDLPNLGAFLPHRGLKWSVRQIFPPLYIWGEKVKCVSTLKSTELKSLFHLCCLPIQLWQGNLRACHRVSHRNVELHIKFIL